MFSSWLNYEEITPHSDLDLAVWNLPEKDYFKAIAELDNGHDFEVNLVEVQNAHSYILGAIAQGVEL